MSAQALEARMTRVEGVLEQVDKRLDLINRRLDGFDARFGQIDSGSQTIAPQDTRPREGGSR
jgi:hypothetical protein